ncbi:unnamed protein product [Orchesella dallaii]|uniref:DUF4806 domain-containing protein n=1 Tax=Orchesella dallaii TaxID=48710 RepID=A0ABP1R6Z8_9HEXA
MTTFSVVEFIEEQTVEVVPSLWISKNKDYCSWPSVIGPKFKTLVLRLARPSDYPKLRWSQLKYSYQTAVQKRNKAENTSNIESSAFEDTPVSRRKRNRVPDDVRKKNRRLQLPNAPLKSSSSSDSSVDFSNDSTYDVNVQIPSDSLFKSEPDEIDIPISHQESSAQQIRTVILPALDNYNVVSNEAQVSQLGDYGQIYRPTTPLGGDFSTLATGDINTTNYNYLPVANIQHGKIVNLLVSIQDQQARDRHENQKFQELVVTKLVTLAHDCKELLARTASSPNVSPEETVCDQILPVDTVEKWKILNEWLTDTSIKNKLAKELSVIGGSRPQLITTRILERLVSLELSLNLTFTGTGKRAEAGFKGSKVLELLYLAVRLTRGGETCTNKDVDQFIQLWLKNATDRFGGRKKRLQKKQNEEIPINQDEAANVLPGTARDPEPHP